MRARVEHDFVSTRRVFNHMSRWPELGVVRPIACYPEHLAIVTEESTGETLLAVLERMAVGFPSRHQMQRLCEITARSGAWLRAFQTLDTVGDSSSINGMRDYIDLRLQRLVAARAARFTERDRQRVIARVERLEAEVQPADQNPVAIHADMAPANILVDGERIVVLDFAMASRGAIYHDLARLYLQIDLLRIKPQYRSGVIQCVQRALLHGFEPSLTSEHPLFRLLLMRHHVNHLTTLSLGGERFPSNIYNWYVRRHHRQWIEQELRVPSCTAGSR
jgi:hypothetical protein